MFKKNINKAYWSIAIPELYLFLDTHWLKRILLHCAMLYSSGMYSIWSQLKHIWGIWGATFVVTCVQMVCYHMLSPCSCHRSVNILAISGITSPNLCQPTTLGHGTRKGNAYIASEQPGTSRPPHYWYLMMKSVDISGMYLGSLTAHSYLEDL